MNIKIEEPTVFRTNVVAKLNKIIRKKKISVNLEKGIYNYTIKTSKDRNVVRKWENHFFAMIYIDKFRSIYDNLNKKGMVQNRGVFGG